MKDGGEEHPAGPESVRRPTVPEAFRKIADFLAIEKVPFVVVGGLAAGLHGEPRATQDVDLMVVLQSSRVAQLAARASSEGFEIEPEHAETQWRFSGFMRLWFGATARRVAVDLMACNSDFLREATWRARPTRLFGRRVPMATAEDVLLFKLSAWREKDVPDARAIVARNGENLELDYLRRWAGWFAEKNECFRAVPERLEALLDGRRLPPANAG